MPGKTASNTINCKLCRQVVPYLKIDTDSMIPSTPSSSSNSLSSSGRALISSLWVMGRMHNLWMISRLMKSSADTRPTPGMYRSPVDKREVIVRLSWMHLVKRNARKKLTALVDSQRHNDIRRTLWRQHGRVILGARLEIPRSRVQVLLWPLSRSCLLVDPSSTPPPCL